MCVGPQHRPGRWLSLGALALAALVGACASPRPPAQAPAAAVSDPCRTAVQPAWSVRRRVVHLAACEWAGFGRPLLLLDAQGWPEAQVAFGPDESALSVWSRVGEYWDVADPSHAAEVRTTAAGAPSRELWPAWRRAWSAAFVSWVMQKAGVASFAPDPAHARYLEAAVQRDPGSVIDIALYAPQPGDLVCAGRGSGPRDAEEFLQRLGDGSGFFPSHCDVVVEVGAESATLIGGNVKNAVTATVTPLREGRLTPTAVRPWAVALVLRESADPCATLSPATGC